jgi:hypothetical protein
MNMIENSTNRNTHLASLENLGNAIAADIFPMQAKLDYKNKTITLATITLPDQESYCQQNGYENLSFKDLSLLCRSTIDAAIKSLTNNKDDIKLTKRAIQQIASSLGTKVNDKIEKRDGLLETCYRVFLRGLQFLSFAGVITIPIGLKIGKKLEKEYPETNQNYQYILNLHDQ